MNNTVVASHAHYYPRALPLKALFGAIRYYARVVLGIREDQIALLSSICSDDLNSVEFPRTDMVGPFILGGLDGFPFGGKTGLAAFSHHAPDNGLALLLFGPHVGITVAGIVGKVLRPGQHAPSDCCGAAAAGLRKLQAGAIVFKSPSEYRTDDYQQETLEQLLLAHEATILDPVIQDANVRFVRMTDVLYGDMEGVMKTLLSGVSFDVPALVIGGVVINADAGAFSSVDLRYVTFLAGGRSEDRLNEFMDLTMGPIAAFLAGNNAAFD